VEIEIVGLVLSKVNFSL